MSIRHKERQLCLGLALWVSFAPFLKAEVPSGFELPEEEFADFEVRVIRPRYFNKNKRFELGVQGLVIANQTFVYTYLLAGLASFHFSERWGVELLSAVGSSQDKDDKLVLDRDFNIKTQIIRTKTLYEASLLWTPIYGKFQLASGRLIYFDTFFDVGAGLSGIEYRFDHCDTSSSRSSPETVHYATGSLGLGQRFFLNSDSSLKWDIRTHLLSLNSQDGACHPDTVAAESLTQQNLTMQFGYTRFF